MAVNVEGTARVWEAARRSGAEKLVNISSLAVRGVSTEGAGDSYGRASRPPRSIWPERRLRRRHSSPLCVPPTSTDPASTGTESRQWWPPG